MIKEKAEPGEYSKGSKYDYDKTLKKVEEYLDSCNEDGVEVLGVGGNAKLMKKVKLPTKTGLARFLGVTSNTLNNWAKKHDKLAALLEFLNDLQHDKLVSGGLGRQYDSGITKLLLHKHGYSDKQESTINGGESILKAIEDVYEKSFGKAREDNKQDQG